MGVPSRFSCPLWNVDGHPGFLMLLCSMDGCGVARRTSSKWLRLLAEILMSIFLFSSLFGAEYTGKWSFFMQRKAVHAGWWNSSAYGRPSALHLPARRTAWIRRKIMNITQLQAEWVYRSIAAAAYVRRAVAIAKSTIPRYRRVLPARSESVCSNLEVAVKSGGSWRKL